MLTDDLDPRDEDEPAPSGRIGLGSPHFARLVRSPAARRVSPRRLFLAVGLGSTLAWGLYELGSRAAAALSRFVAAQPEHQIPFDAIELIPPPPPFIRSGSAAILDAVRGEGRFEPSLSVPDVDLEKLRSALKLNPWVESVGSVRASYRHVAAEVAYRKPLALMAYPVKTERKRYCTLVDRNGVVMPFELDGFEWAEKTPRARPVRGASPLIEIWGFGAGLPGRVGYTWKPASPDVPEAKIGQALRLAEYLAARAHATTPQGRPYPDFLKIDYTTEATKSGELSGFFLYDAHSNWILWGSGPGDEGCTEIRADEKWRMLGQYIDEQGKLAIGGEPQDHLKFTSKGAEVSRDAAKGHPSPRTGR